MAHAGMVRFSLEGHLCGLESGVKPFSWLPMTGPSFEMRAASFRREKTEPCRPREIFPG